MKKIPLLSLLWAVIFAHTNVDGQSCDCITVSLPETYGPYCPNDHPASITMSAAVSGGYEFLDCSWTPVAGLSNPTNLTTDLIVPSSTTMYCVSVNALSNTNEIVNGDFEAGNAGFASGYVYDPSTAPTGSSTYHYLLEGSYNVATNMASYGPLACDFGDHTTGAGNMMIVNGRSNSPAPGPPPALMPITWQETVPICPGAKYKFSMWYANWSLPTSPAQLQVSINGFTAPLVISGSLCGIWKQLQFDWPGDGTGLATITITDLNNAFNSNDFVLDDISLRRYCSVTECTNVVINPLPHYYGVAETTGHTCAGDMLVFEVHTDPGMIVSYDVTPPPVPPLMYWTPAPTGYLYHTMLASPPSTSIHITGISDPATGCWLPVDEELPVTVCPKPDAGTISGDPIICAGETHTYTTTSVSPGGSWMVSPASAGSITMMGGVFTSNPSFPGGTVTITYGVYNCCGADEKTFIVNILPLAAIPSVVYTGCTPPCPGTPLTFDISGDPGSFVTWEWTDPLLGVHSMPGFFIPAVGPPVYTITISTVTYPPGSYGLTILTVTGTNNCPRAGLSTNIDVEWPNADFWQSPARICAGNSAMLVVAGPPGGVVYMSATPADPSLPPSILLDPVTGIGSASVFPTVTTTYQITGITGICCTHMSPGSTATVTVMPVPVVTLTSAACEGQPLILTATSTPASGTYDWTLPGGYSTTTSSPTYTVTPYATILNNGPYSVTAWLGTCSATATTTVDVATEPLITSSSVWDAYGNCVPVYSSSIYPATIEFNAQLYGLSLSGAWVWGCAPIPGIQTLTSAVPNVISPCNTYSSAWATATCLPSTPVYSTYCPLGTPPTVLISYMVATTVSSLGCKWPISVPQDPDCSEEGRPGHNNSLAIDLQNSNSLAVVPNPNSGDFTLKGDVKATTNNAIARVEVVDLLGKVVLSEDCPIEKGKINKQIALGNNLANGVYIIKVKNDNQSYIVRFTLNK